MLKDQGIQKWDELICNSSKAVNYKIFRNQSNFEFYVDDLPKTKGEILRRFRTSNFRLTAGIGR
jgi:hypothetical protein